MKSRALATDLLRSLVLATTMTLSQVSYGFTVSLEPGKSIVFDYDASGIGPYSGVYVQVVGGALNNWDLELWSDPNATGSLIYSCDQTVVSCVGYVYDSKLADGDFSLLLRHIAPKPVLGAPELAFFDVQKVAAAGNPASIIAALEPIVHETVPAPGTLLLAALGLAGLGIVGSRGRAERRAGSA